MAERLQREPTMEEIVVALRETRKGADRVTPFGVVTQPRGNRVFRGLSGSTDLSELRDGEIERLLAENARLNARIVSLLKVIEHEQARHAETAEDAVPVQADRNAIVNEVREALETELSPILLVLLRMLERQRTDPTADENGTRAAFPISSTGAPSEWIIDLMHKLDIKAPAPTDSIASPDPMLRRSTLRDRVAEILNAFRLEPNVGAPRRGFTPTQGPL